MFYRIYVTKIHKNIYFLYQIRYELFSNECALLELLKCARSYLDFSYIYKIEINLGMK